MTVIYFELANKLNLSIDKMRTMESTMAGGQVVYSEGIIEHLKI